ncbi:unnamed protein product [Hymenolepis diminuta]|uniref:Uncharacterized protein n=1 Tax=Hymenolepis diminuta TaxID=6216 RepID=A0A564YR33_HYMDI|nr:unnamed protein product [Hymenolepis diminuta]
MLRSNEIRLKYGAYEACGISLYRIQRLEGLINLLKLDGYNVLVEEIPLVRDVLEIWMMDEKMYTCNIKDLNFGGDGYLDIKAKEIHQKIRDSFQDCTEN